MEARVIMEYIIDFNIIAICCTIFFSVLSFSIAIFKGMKYISLSLKENRISYVYDMLSRKVNNIPTMRALPPVENVTENHGPIFSEEEAAILADIHRQTRLSGSGCFNNIKTQESHGADSTSSSVEAMKSVFNS